MISGLKKQFNQIALEWMPHSRVNMMTFMTSIEFFVYVSWLWFVKCMPSVHPHVNINTINALLPQSIVLLMMPMFFHLLYKFWLHTEERFWFWQVMSVLSYALTLTYILFLIGEASFLAGIFIAGSPLLGLLIFNRNIMFVIFLLNIGFVFAILFATNAGVLPASPLFPNGQFFINGFWLNTFMYFAMPKVITIFVAIDLILLEIKRKKTEIEYLSETDPLTGLYNRYSFQKYMYSHIAPLDKASIIIMDLDFFKKINDTYGHLFGDTVLKEVADFLKTYVRKDDIVARFGGEEFIMFLYHTNVSDTLKIAEDIRKGISLIMMQDEDGEQFSISVSIGVAHQQFVVQEQGIIVQSDLYQEELANFFDSMIMEADHALYEAKGSGRNKVIYAGDIIKPSVLKTEAFFQKRNAFNMQPKLTHQKD